MSLVSDIFVFVYAFAKDFIFYHLVKSLFYTRSFKPDFRSSPENISSIQVPIFESTPGLQMK